MLKIGAIVWGVQDIHRGVLFWSEALNYELRYPLHMEPSPDFAILVPKNGVGVQLSLNKVTSDKPKRHHLDLFTEDQAGEVERLLNLGQLR